MVDYDQLALVHAKEAVLTPRQTSILRNDILGNNRHSLMNLLLDFQNAYDGIASNSYISNNSDALIIEHAEVNMNVSQLANDYDARRAADTVMDQMLRIASKTRVKNSVGR